MKSGLLSVFILGLLSASHGAELSREGLQFQIDKFHRMRSTGITMTSMGVAHLVLGVVLISTAKDRIEGESGGSSTTHYDPKRPLGIISTSIGVPLSVVGLILWGIGNERFLRYQQLLNSVSLRLDLEPSREDIAFSYAF